MQRLVLVLESRFALSRSIRYLHLGTSSLRDCCDGSGGRLSSLAWVNMCKMDYFGGEVEIIDPFEVLPDHSRMQLTMRRPVFLSLRPSG